MENFVEDWDGPTRGKIFLNAWQRFRGRRWRLKFARWVFSWGIPLWRSWGFNQAANIITGSLLLRSTRMLLNMTKSMTTDRVLWHEKNELAEKLPSHFPSIQVNVSSLSYFSRHSLICWPPGGTGFQRSQMIISNTKYKTSWWQHYSYSTSTPATVGSYKNSQKFSVGFSLSRPHLGWYQILPRAAPLFVR